MQTKFPTRPPPPCDASHFRGARIFLRTPTPESARLRLNATPFAPWTLLRYWKVPNSRCVSAPQPGAKPARIGIVLGLTLLAALSASVGCVSKTRHAEADAPPPYLHTSLSLRDYPPAPDVSANPES